MEFGGVQIAVTSLLLVLAAATLLVCNRRRSKRNHRGKVSARPLMRGRPVQHNCEPPVQRVSSGTFMPEIAVLAEAGMREENSAWRKREENSAPDFTFLKKLSKPENSNALQLPPLTVDELLFDILVTGGSADDLKKHVADRSERQPEPRHEPRPALQERSPERHRLPSAETQFEIIQAPVHPFVRPTGMIDRPTLARLLRENRSFSGVAVAISINEEESRWCSEGLLEWVENYIGGLLEENDFGCRTGKKEFLIVCPGVTGAKAQRRLHDISERLWEFQLRGIGTYSIVFSWGGVEAQNRPLTDALTAATERMCQSRLGRNSIYMHSVNTRRNVV
jgi:hypothetical protein